MSDISDEILERLTTFADRLDSDHGTLPVGYIVTTRLTGRPAFFRIGSCLHHLEESLWAEHGSRWADIYHAVRRARDATPARRARVAKRWLERRKTG